MHRIYIGHETINKESMLVIHPKDRTTTVLSLLYEGLEVKLMDQSANSAQIKKILNHTSQQERIMLLGHGLDKG